MKFEDYELYKEYQVEIAPSKLKIPEGWIYRNEERQVANILSKMKIPEGWIYSFYTYNYEDIDYSELICTHRLFVPFNK
jgi:hypothetical protein